MSGLLTMTSHPENFRKNGGELAESFFKTALTILEHFAAIRPATLERRPFVGFHPLIHKSVS